MLTDRGRLGLGVGALVASGIAAASARPAVAAGPDPRLVEARALFVEAEHDEDAGRWQDALDKVRRVGEVKRTAGVRFHEALCEEHLGRLTRALTDYTAAEDQARSENAQDVLRPVGKRIA
ncbi:MAG TPA: hypothetical protein VKU41_29630, partial [Polyangiaceae bacterium]|nr:hypothetical protein [Polyangiaceae bacterium]